ncbi:MAG: hypothetical protein GY789_22320 [Hyphomicrobiales bacterium]|nr:hypothetical protein [Hyphomicrobiales bacterium]MCP4999205.1 hypothetical protein [Hyphomicrobiales bacterium]
MLFALCVLLAITLAWFASKALFMVVTENAPAALVLVPGVGFLDRAPSDLRLLKAGDNILVVAAGDAGYVRRLYGAGAWLVLPSLRNVCLDLGPTGPGNTVRSSG